jgi:hypothetical protein
MTTSAPGRRAFLRSGGLAVAGAAAGIVVAACSGDDEPAEGGDPPDASSEPGGPTRTTFAALAGDVDLAIGAVEIEHSAVAAYDALVGARGEDLRAIGVLDTALLFRDHHAEHATALNGLLVDVGAAPVPGDHRFAGITLPTVEEVEELAVAALVELARDIEDRAAQTYITAVPRLSRPGIRRTLMAVGAVEARHAAAYDLLAGGGPAGYLATAQHIVAGNHPTDASLLLGP